MSPNAESLLFGLTLLLYLASSVSYHAHLFTGSERARSVAFGTVSGGLAAHFAAIGVWCVHHGSLWLDPGMPFSVVAFFLALVQVIANFRRPWSALGSLSVPLAFILQFTAVTWSRTEPGVVDPARSVVLRLHVLVLLLGFAAFALAFCLAVIYLVQARLLKTKQIRGFFSRLPPLESVANVAHWMATLGFSMLTLGMITGAIAAPERWGPHWYLDARTLTSLVAWAIYAAYLGVSTVLGWRGRRTTYFLIAGFLVVLVAFVASVNRPAARVAVQPPAVTAPGPLAVSRQDCSPC